MGDCSTSGVALAELAVGHISHVSWIVRERASAVVARALLNGNIAVAEALSRFAQPDASDDILERAGRCMAAARKHNGFVKPPCLEQLDRILATHPSQMLRDLSAVQPPALARPLSLKYELISPNENVPRVGSGKAFPGPYESIYEELARALDLDRNAMLRVAAEYATEALVLLPEQNAVLEALHGSGVRHIYPSEELAASRAAAGRVLVDVLDAGLLELAPSRLRRQLRTVDIQLVDRAPHHRPSVIPPPPVGGVDKSVDWWQTGVEDRLSEFIGAAEDGDQVLIGASMRLTLLNWGRLAEYYECGTSIGTTGTAGDAPFVYRDSMKLQDLITPTRRGGVEIGAPMVVENIAHSFHQFEASWLSFRPDLAATLGWMPDSAQPGSWRTPAGDLAVQTIWWVDGWWGHTGQSFDDTEAQGYVVVLTYSGLRDAVAAFGDMTRHFTLTRSGRKDGAEITPSSATQSLSIHAQLNDPK